MRKTCLSGMLSDSDFIKRLTGLAVPIALQSLLLACVGASDTIMLGALEQNAMASVSLATQIQFVQNVIVLGVVAAFQVLGAQYMGKNDRATVNKLLFMSLRITVLISLFFAGMCFCIPESLMKIFTNEQVLIDIGIGYLKMASISYLLAGFSQCFIALVKLGPRASDVAWISGVTVVLNIGLNAVFIFGLFGFPAMGVLGAALATSVSRAFEFILSSVACFRNRTIRPDFSYLFSTDRILSRDFFRQLIPLMGAFMIWTLGFTSYSAFMGHLGVDAAAANSVSSVVRSLVISFIRGLAGGSAVLIGFELGSGRLERAKLYGDRIVFLSLVFGVFTSALMIAMIPVAKSVIRLSECADAYFISMQIILAVYIVGCSFNSVVINGIFAAGGDTAYDCYSLAATMWGVAVPLAALGTFVFGWPVALVYSCTCLDEVGKTIWTWLHYRKYRWLKNLTRAT